MAEHQHQCRQCYPERFPPIPADSRAPYIGVDNGGGWVPWWAHRWQDGEPTYRFRVIFNDIDLSRPRRVDSWCVTEALAGEMGWLVRQSESVLNSPERRRCQVQHRCRGVNQWSHSVPLMCERAEYGRVVLVRDDGLQVDGAPRAEPA